MIPYAPAIVAALHDATGVWIDAFPLTPDRVVARFRAHGVGPPSVPGVTSRPAWRGPREPVASSLQSPGDFPGHEGSTRRRPDAPAL